MNIEQQTELAKKFTERLLKHIVQQNQKVLNKDGNGCSVSSINVYYDSTSAAIEVTFESSNTIDSPVSSFKCVSSI